MDRLGRPSTLGGYTLSFNYLITFVVYSGALYNLSDDQVEYQMRDRLSFVRFLGLALEDKVPDAKTVWL